MFVAGFAAQLRFCQIGVNRLAIIIFHHHMVPGRRAQFVIGGNFILFRLRERILGIDIDDDAQVAKSVWRTCWPIPNLLAIIGTSWET